VVTKFESAQFQRALCGLFFCFLFPIAEFFFAFLIDALRVAAINALQGE